MHGTRGFASPRLSLAGQMFHLTRQKFSALCTRISMTCSDFSLCFDLLFSWHRERPSPPGTSNNLDRSLLARPAYIVSGSKNHCAQEYPLSMAVFYPHRLRIMTSTICPFFFLFFTTTNTVVKIRSDVAIYIQLNEKMSSHEKYKQ